MADYFSEIQESQLPYLTWNKTPIGNRLQSKQNKLKPQVNPPEADIAPSSCKKNLLRAYVLAEFDKEWVAFEWETPYQSGFKLCDGYRTAGNVVMDRILVPSPDTNKRYFEQNLSQFQAAWKETNGACYPSYEAFTQMCSHTEQTFLFDVLQNKKAPEKMPYFSKPLTVILHLFSTRRACERCSQAICRLFTKPQNREKFIKNAFRNSLMNTQNVDLKVLFTHLAPGANVIVGPQDFFERRERIWNITQFNAYGPNLQLKSKESEQVDNEQQSNVSSPKKPGSNNIKGLADFAALIHLKTTK